MSANINIKIFLRFWVLVLNLLVIDVPRVCASAAVGQEQIMERSYENSEEDKKNSDEQSISWLTDSYRDGKRRPSEDSLSRSLLLAVAARQGANVFSVSNSRRASGVASGLSISGHFSGAGEKEFEHSLISTEPGISPGVRRPVDLSPTILRRSSKTSNQASFDEHD